MAEFSAIKRAAKAKGRDGLRPRRLRAGDGAAMHELEAACFSMPWTAAQCEGALRQGNFAAFGLWRGDSLAAYISFYHSGDELEILNLAVHPFARRRGHGGRLLRLLLQAGRKMGMRKAALEVREGNFAALALYEQAGFRQAGLRKRYYGDTGEDALVYTRDI